ncbi:MAG: ketopantoate reductase family protein [Myxococcota bacterium]
MSRVLVVGCGGIGGTLAAALSRGAAETGDRVVGLSTNPEIVAAVRAHGYRVRDRGAPEVAVPGDIVDALAPDDRFDLVVLATQPPQVEDAARSVVANLADDGAMVVLQNGLCEERVAAIAGADRTLGAVVMWGASMLAPGVYARTSAGGFVIGRLDGGEDARLATLARLFSAVGPVAVTADLRGARWSKLAINCAISTLGTLGGDRVGALLRHAFVRRLALEIMTEVVHVARAEGVHLQKVSGALDLDWVALTDAERAGGSPTLAAKHALLFAVGLRYRNLRSSMLAAIERGRPPAVDFLNGEIVTRGRRHGVPVPVNAAATALVHAVARGERAPGLDTLRALAREVEPAGV